MRDFLHLISDNQHELDFGHWMMPENDAQDQSPTYEDDKVIVFNPRTAKFFNKLARFGLGKEPPKIFMPAYSQEGGFFSKWTDKSITDVSLTQYKHLIILSKHGMRPLIMIIMHLNEFLTDIIDTDRKNVFTAMTQKSHDAIVEAFGALLQILPKQFWNRFLVPHVYLKLHQQNKLTDQSFSLIKKMADDFKNNDTFQILSDIKDLLGKDLPPDPIFSFFSADMKKNEILKKIKDKILSTSLNSLKAVRSFAARQELVKIIENCKEEIFDLFFLVKRKRFFNFDEENFDDNYMDTVMGLTSSIEDEMSKNSTIITPLLQHLSASAISDMLFDDSRIIVDHYIEKVIEAI